MARDWFHIAKADFFVITSGFRAHRRLGTVLLYTLGILWALILAPIAIGGFTNLLVGGLSLQPLLMQIFPGLMRSFMLLLWIMLLLFPISQSLAEIKIGQWEIFLSNNVRTKDILTGTFFGSMPMTGFVTLLLAPLIVVPFVTVFQVSVLGMALMYLVVGVMVLTTIWLSNFITAAVQSKLGDSSRGNDIAKALAMVIALCGIGPMYAIMFMAPTISGFLGTDVFLLLPFTWSADVTSWIAITFNGVGLTGSQILGFQNVLTLDAVTSFILMIGFGVFAVVATLLTADRLFTITAGARTEVITTVGNENIILRSIRRIAPGAFGSLIVTNLKDYLRKAQNLSKMAYGIVLATILPFLMTVIDDEYISLMAMLPMIGSMLSLAGTFPFAGVGFLESKDQLWIIQGSPSGASRYVKSRLVSAFLVTLPLIMFPAVVISILFQATIVEAIILGIFGYFVACGGAMVAIGVTARNPNYEDTKSPAHQANLMTSVMIAQFSLIGFLFVDIFLAIALDVDIFETIINFFPMIHPMAMMAFFGGTFLFLIGALFVYSGIRSLSSPDN